MRNVEIYKLYDMLLDIDIIGTDTIKLKYDKEKETIFASYINNTKNIVGKSKSTFNYDKDFVLCIGNLKNFLNILSYFSNECTMEVKNEEDIYLSNEQVNVNFRQANKMALKNEYTNELPQISPGVEIELVTFNYIINALKSFKFIQTQFLNVVVNETGFYFVISDESGNQSHIFISEKIKSKEPLSLLFDLKHINDILNKFNGCPVSLSLDKIIERDNSYILKIQKNTDDLITTFNVMNKIN